MRNILNYLKLLGFFVIFIEFGLIVFFYATPSLKESQALLSFQEIHNQDISQEAKISQPYETSRLEITKLYGKLDCADFENNPIAGPMLSAINADRKNNGKLSLTWNVKLCLSAQLKAQDMAEYHYFDHVSPTFVTPWHWMDVAEYHYQYSGENLALNYYTAQEAHSALMNSPGHRANILSEEFQEIGLAYFWGKVDGQEAFFIVEHFGTPLISQKSSITCEKDLAKNNIKKLKKQQNTVEEYLKKAEEVLSEYQQQERETKKIENYIEDLKDKEKEIKKYIQENEAYLEKCP